MFSLGMLDLESIIGLCYTEAVVLYRICQQNKKFSILPLSDTIYLFFLVFCLMVLDSSFGITRKYSLGAKFQKLSFGAPLLITRTVVLFLVMLVQYRRVVLMSKSRSYVLRSTIE